MGNPQPSPKLIKIMGYIYCITSPSGKKYIGQTRRNCEKRFNEHCKLTNSCILLENAIKKYGKNQMKLEVLEEIENDLLDVCEQFYIELFSTLEPNGYNIKSGGETGQHSELSRQRMSISKIGEKNHNFGKPRSDETKLAISQAKSGENHHFYGKNLSIQHKLQLSKSHKKTKPELPMYMVYVKERPKYYQGSGYAIVNHPILKDKYFTSKKYNEEEKYKLAFEYLNQHGCSSETKC